MRIANHQKRSDDPVQNNTESHLDPDILGAENMMQGFESNLAQNGIHHDEKANRYRFMISIWYTTLGVLLHVPIGTETPTNWPFCKAGPVFGTKLPRMIPIAMARKIHIAKKRSRRPRLENIDFFATYSCAGEPGCWPCFSISLVFD